MSAWLYTDVPDFITILYSVSAVYDHDLVISKIILHAEGMGYFSVHWQRGKC